MGAKSHACGMKSFRKKGRKLVPDNIATPIVFLDIDGVLQPVNNENRFNYDMTAIQNELAEKFNDDIYTKIDKYDVAAVWIDWEGEPDYKIYSEEDLSALETLPYVRIRLKEHVKNTRLKGSPKIYT